MVHVGVKVNVGDLGVREGDAVNVGVAVNVAGNVGGPLTAVVGSINSVSEGDGNTEGVSVDG